MTINRRDIIEILREDIDVLKKQKQQADNHVRRLQQAFRALNEIVNLTASMESVPDLEQLMYQLLQSVMHACNTEHGSLILLDGKLDELEFVEVIGDTRDALKGHRISLDTGVVGRSIAERRGMLVEDVRLSSAWSSATDEAIGFNTQSLMCVPLVDSDRVIGAIEVVNKVGDLEFEQNDLNILCIAGRLVSLALGRAEILTSLPEEITP